MVGSAGFVLSMVGFAAILLGLITRRQLLCRYFRHTRLCYTRYLLYALVIRQLAEVADVEQMLLALQLQLLKKTTDDTELQHIARCCTIITQ